MKYGIVFLVLLIPLLSVAAVYKYKDQDGNIHYTDQPREGAKIIQLPKTSIVNTNNQNRENSKDGKAKNKSDQDSPKDQPPLEVQYKIFQISTPSPEQTFQNMQNIPVLINIEPELQKGDTIAIFLDGVKVIGPAPQDRFELQQPDRGVHSVQAKLYNSNGELKRQSNVVTFYIHRPNLNSRRGRP